MQETQPSTTSAARLTLRPLAEADRNWVRAFVAERWGAEIVVAHGQVYHPHELPGFRAEQDGEPVGLLTYHIAGRACEIVTLDAVTRQQGIGSALIDALRPVAIEAGCRRLWLVTTNDNLDGLRFYQRRGFRIVAVRPDAMDEVRRHKPGIPDTGAYGIPLRDELELEEKLPRDSGCWMESDEGW